VHIEVAFGALSEHSPGRETCYSDVAKHTRRLLVRCRCTISVYFPPAQQFLPLACELFYNLDAQNTTIPSETPSDRISEHVDCVFRGCKQQI
jgi:hypothetical protein